MAPSSGLSRFVRRGHHALALVCVLFLAPGITWSAKASAREGPLVAATPTYVPMFRYDSRHSGVSPQTTLSPANASHLTQRWRFVTGGPVFSGISLADGIAYVGSGDGNLYALDLQTGELRWSFHTGGRTNHTPAVVDGLVYAAANGQPYVWALDAATGALRWQQRIGQVGGSPVLDGGRLFLPTVATVPELVALNASNGTILWRYRLDAGARATPAVSNRIVYIGDEKGYFHAVRADNGTRVWRFLHNPNPCPVQNRWQYDCGGIYSSASVVDGRVYFGARDDRLWALDAATGVVQWSYKTARHVEGSPAVAGGVVYVSGNDTYVYAFNATTGRMLWRTKTGRSIDSSVTYSNGLVIVGSNDMSLYVFDAQTGAVLWRTLLPDLVMATPTVADGVILTGTGRLPLKGPATDTSVYAFELPPTLP